MNKHLKTLNKTVRESYCRFTTQERKALHGTTRSLLLLFNADKCKRFTVPLQPGVDQLSRKIKSRSYDLPTERWRRTATSSSCTFCIVLQATWDTSFLRKPADTWLVQMGLSQALPEHGELEWVGAPWVGYPPLGFSI